MTTSSEAKSEVSDGLSTPAAKRCFQGSYTVLFARLAIMTLMAVAICLTTLVTFYWTQRSSTEAVRGLGDSLRYDLLDRSVDIMNSTLNDQTARLQLAGTAVYSQYQNTGSFFGTALDLKTWSLVYNKRHVRNFGLVLENGLYQYTYSQSMPDGVKHYKNFANVSTAPLVPQVSYIEPLDVNGNPEGSPQLFTNSVDFRQRAYYIHAREGPSDTIFLSLLFSIQSYPVLLAAAPVKSNETGETLGVYTIATTLDDLSAYISALDLRGGSLYFKTLDNILVAAANSSSDFQSNTLGALKYVNQSDSALIRAADAFVSKTWSPDVLHASAVKAADVNLLGTLYYVDTLPLVDYDLQVVAVLMIPRQSIMGPIDRRRTQTILLLVCLSCGIFVIGCILVFCLTTRVSTEVRLKAELGEAKKRAEANSEAKSRFLSNMSHELRTPMAGILGLLDILLTDELSPENLVNISQIRQCATGLLGLLNNLLDLGKIEAGKVDLEWADFDLIAELESLVDMFSVQCNQKGIEIGLDLAKDMQRTVKGDQARIRQVFANLLSNAIKFSSEGGQIVVRGRSVEDSSPSKPSSEAALLVSPPQNSTLRRIFRRNKSFRRETNPSLEWGEKLRYAFEVDDTGLGIPPEKRELVFENFVQADSSTTRLHGGTGLGLGIVRSLVGMMGGEIRVKDKVGPGTLMGFTVCFERASEVRYSMRYNPVDLPLRMNLPLGTRVVLGIPGDLSRQIAARFIGEQGLEVWETHDWPGVLELMSCHVDPVPKKAEGPSCTSKDAASNQKEVVSPYGGICPDAKPSDCIAIDMDCLESAGERRSNGNNADPPALLVILDIKVMPPPENGSGLERCLEKLRKLAPGAVIAWLVSTDTPASTRQVLKAWSPGGSALLATKPVYWSRLHSLLEAMSERLDSLRWTGAATRGIPRKATRFASSPLGRGADVTASAAAAADVTSRRTNGGGPSEGPRGTENVSRSSGDGLDSGGTRFEPPDRNDPTVEDDMSHGGASKGAQETRCVVADEDRSRPESLLREPKSGGIEREITAGEGPILEMEPISKKGLTTGRVLTPGTVNPAGTLPLTPRKERTSAKAELQELGPALAGMRILVAEDTPILQKLAVAMLQRLGAEVTAVGDGLQAADLFLRHYAQNGNGTAAAEMPFTCVLMDCQMPAMDGYDSTRAIRRVEQDSGHHTPIVALTAHAMASDQSKCLEAGMDAYLSKPINPTLLVSTLQSVARWPSK